jgi:hypothetical protein
MECLLAGKLKGKQTTVLGILPCPVGVPFVFHSAEIDPPHGSLFGLYWFFFHV